MGSYIPQGACVRRPPAKRGKSGGAISGSRSVRRSHFWGRRTIDVGLSFRGEFSQKVDSKGRMSIPADFRRVLEAGDPNCPETPHPRLVVLYGPHLKDCLHVYTIDDMAEIEAGIRRLPRGSDARKRASRMILGKSWETDVDRDGRIVLPKDRRVQIGLESEVHMVAMGDYFEIWSAENYSAIEEVEMSAYLETEGDDFDPLTLIPTLPGE